MEDQAGSGRQDFLFDGGQRQGPEGRAQEVEGFLGNSSVELHVCICYRMDSILSYGRCDRVPVFS